MRSTTVLVVDDEDLVRQSLGAILTVFGMNTLFAANGEMAIQIFEKNPQVVDVILLDLTLPDLSGDEVFRKIRQLDPNVAFVVMSGMPIDSVRNRFPETQRLTFLSKPAPINELVQIINSLVKSDPNRPNN